ncbi:MAG: sigma-70 family RNA polymerase sigma factor [Bryobacteraceae bacterium]|nr:sigma-70 family RNA polymerase sigma factor [Bryobacteraceae bacterium]
MLTAVSPNPSHASTIAVMNLPLPLPLPLPLLVTMTAEPAEYHQREAPLSEAQFGDAFQSCFPLTLRFLLSRGVAADVAEEVAQAAWVKGWECRDQLQRPQMIAAWVNSIAKNMLKNRRRTEQRLESLTDLSKASTQPQPSVDMGRILQRCDGRDAKILWGFYVEGYTTEEIAGRLGLSPVAVRVRMLRLRNALRLKLSKPTPPVHPIVQAA